MENTPSSPSLIAFEKWWNQQPPIADLQVQEGTRLIALAAWNASCDFFCSGFPADPAFCASDWQQGDRAHQMITERLEEIIPELIHHVGTDDYDNSIEIFFLPSTPADFTLSPAQVEAVCALGFGQGWANFTDGTEIYFGVRHQKGTGQVEAIVAGERRCISYPRWSLKEYEAANGWPSWLVLNR